MHTPDQHLRGMTEYPSPTPNSVLMETSIMLNVNCKNQEDVEYVLEHFSKISAHLSGKDFDSHITVMKVPADNELLI